MISNSGNTSVSLIKPNEFIKLQILKRKKKQLTDRISKTKASGVDTETDKEKLLEAVITHKRKNPFAKSAEGSKRPKTEINTELQSISEDSVLSLIATPPSKNELSKASHHQRSPPPKFSFQPFDSKAFSKLFQYETQSEDESVQLEQKFSKHLPIDWSLKTKARFFCETEMPATKLKTNQEASGLTSYVRCIDTRTSSGGLDISPATKLNQGTYYWQHPHLPWLTLFPRNSKENIGIQLGERERKALASDWSDSFRGLFQLLRARQCPYFYVCANTFSVLFRAAGVGGHVEIHAFMSPTSKGMRALLRQEGIEFTQPMKKDSNLNKSTDDSEVKEEQENVKPPTDNDDGDEEEEEEAWLESLGVDEKEIRKISTVHNRQQQQTDMLDDFSENSAVLIEGVDCQAFFNFLLNAKSSIASVGRLAGVPPTLFSPVAFPKATIQNLSCRSSKVRLDGIDYFSVELKGVILPTVLPYVCGILRETKDTFSATTVSTSSTLVFTKASARLMNATKSENDSSGEQVFGKENLSDCGLHPEIVDALCQVKEHAVGLVERVCFKNGYGYAWS